MKQGYQNLNHINNLGKKQVRLSKNCKDRISEMIQAVMFTGDLLI